jgi:hypothetical protein
MTTLIPIPVLAEDSGYNPLKHHALTQPKIMLRLRLTLKNDRSPL